MQGMFRGARSAQDKARARASLAAHEFPEWYPSYSTFLVDPANGLWIQAPHTGADTTRTWYGFSESGILRGKLTVPASLQLFEIGAVHVLGRWSDEDGAESLRRYARVQLSR